MNKKDKEFVLFMEDRREASERHYVKSGYLAAFKRFDQLWNRILPEKLQVALKERKKRAGELAQFVPPTIFQLHRDLHTRICAAFRMAEPNFYLIGRGGVEDEKIAKENEALVKFNMDYDDGSGNYGQKRKQIIGDALKYGIGVMYLQFGTDYIRAPMETKNEEDGTLEWLWEQKKKFEGVKATRILPHRFRPDPMATNRKEIRWFTFDKASTVGELKDNEEELELKNLKEIDVNGFPKEKYWEYFPTSKDIETIKTDDKKAVRAAPVLLTYHIDREGLSVYANRTTLISGPTATDNSGELPIVTCVLIPKDDELVGKSIVSVIEDLFYESFHKRNTRLDKQTTSVAGCYQTTDPTYKNKPWLHGGPGRVFVHQPGTDFKPIEFHDSTDVELREDQICRQEMKDALHISDISMGVNPQRQERATTAAILNENASVPMRDLIEQAEETLEKPYIMKGLQLLNENLSVDFKYRVLGGQGWEQHTMENPRRDIRVDQDIVCVTATQFESRTLKRQSYTNMIMSLLHLPNAQRLNWQRLSRKFIELHGEENIEEIVPDDETLAAYPRQENMALLQGVMLQPQMTDDDNFHLRIHSEPMQQGQASPMLQQHMMMHQQQLMMKQGQQPSRQEMGGAQPSQAQPTSEEDMVKIAGEKISQGGVLGG